MKYKHIFLILFILLSQEKGLYSQQPRLVLPVGHTGDITAAEYSKSGKYIVTGSYDNTAKVWDANTGFLLTNLVGHKDMILRPRFSQDEKKILTAACDSTVKIWDTNSGSLLFELKGPVECIYTADFSSDGKRIVSSSGDSTGMIWNGNTGALVANLIGHHRSINKISFSHDGKRIVTASKDSTAKIWDAATGRLLGTLKGHFNSVTDAQFSPDGKLVLTVSEDRIVGIWDASTYISLKGLTGHIDYITVGSFSPDGKKALTASWDGSIIVWDVKSGKVLKEVSHPDWIISAQFSPDGKKIVSTSKDGTLKIWDSNTGVIINQFNREFLKEALFSPGGQKVLTISGGSLFSSFYSVEIFDAVSGRLFKDLTGSSSDLRNAEFSADGKKIMMASQNRAPEIWDAGTGKIIHTAESRDEKTKTADLSPDGNSILTVSEKSLVSIWNSQTGKTIERNRERFSKETPRLAVHSSGFSPDGMKAFINYKTIPFVEVLDTENGRVLYRLKHESVSLKKIPSVQFSPDGSKVITTSQDKTSRIWTADSGKLLMVLKDFPGEVDYATFSPDSRKIIICADSTSEIVDAQSGTYLTKLRGQTSKVNDVQFSPDGKVILTCWKENYWGTDHAARTWDAETGKMIKVLNLHDSWINSAGFSPNGKFIATASNDHRVGIWSVDSGQVITTLAGHSSAVNTAQFHPAGHTVITSSADNTVKLWKIPSGDLICTMLSVDSGDYFVQIPSGYYQCSPNAAKLLHYVTNNLEVISFEQLDVKYNRPDKVLEAIGNTDTALIKSYRKAWEKRIKKLGIDTTAFREGYSVPEAGFTNRDAIGYEQKIGTIKLHIRGIDSTYKLDRFNAWINETPVFGQRGINIRKRNKNHFDTTITVKLSQGENRIETSITNVNGTESYRMPLTVNYSPPVKRKEMTRFIGIGIDQFSDKKHNLQYSAKDIRDLALKLREKYGNDIIIDTLFNENVTAANVKAFKQKLLGTTENDKVIIAYSGHGMLSKEYDYYLSTYAVNFDKPEENGLPYDELENLLDSIPARKKLLLIDACHSGEVDKEDLVTLSESPDSLIKGLKPVAYKKDGQLGLKNSFELMQSLFVNVGKSTGATIISAAAGTQFALERNDLKNGVFTYSILEAMNMYPTLKISELKKIVGERVEQLTKGLQKPTSRNETIAVDWNLW